MTQAQIRDELIAIRDRLGVLRDATAYPALNYRNDLDAFWAGKLHGMLKIVTEIIVMPCHADILFGLANRQ